MNILAPLPMPVSATGRFYRLCASVLNTTSRRHQSSYRRARRRLNIKPDPAFLPSKTELYDHIIHNPPSSMPNVYHTPSLFLPKDDQRRLLQQASQTQISGDSTSASHKDHSLPPALKPVYEKSYHLGTQDFDRMRQLRAEDPYKWSVKALAKEFACSGVAVRMACEGLGKEKQEFQQKVTDAVKKTWGTKRRNAREERTLRREEWYRDA